MWFFYTGLETAIGIIAESGKTERFQPILRYLIIKGDMIEYRTYN